MLKQFIIHKTYILAIIAAFLISFTHAATTAVSLHLEKTATNADNLLVEGDSSEISSDLTSEAPPGTPTESPPNPDLPPLTPTFTSHLMVKAFYPGDSSDNAGEFIELYKTIDGNLDLSGYKLRYTNGRGVDDIIWEFAEGTMMTGQTMVLRYSKSPDAAESDAVYTASLARTAGPLEILLDGDPVDSVCWAGAGKTGCVAGYKTGESLPYVRDLAHNTLAKTEDYQPAYDKTGNAVIWPVLVDDEPSSPPHDETAGSISARCRGLQFTEVYAYHDGNQQEQFVELYNSTSQPIDTTHCALGYKKKTYAISGLIGPNSYQAYYPASLGFSLTKNPASTNSITLIDADGKVVDELVYPHGQKKSTSYALIFATTGETLWQPTYARTPGVENIYQKFRTCEAGKVINEATGNCVKAEALDTALADCPEGKYRNPLTGRCKSLSSETTVKPCAEGYERNPETNRCRKIVAENSGANYALVPSTASSGKSFIALGVVALIVSAGIIYIILQYRLEIVRMLRKLRQRIHHVS